MISIQTEEAQDKQPLDIRSEISLRSYIATSLDEMKRLAYTVDLSWLLRERNPIECEKLALLVLDKSTSSSTQADLLIAKANTVFSFLNFRRSDYVQSIKLANDSLSILKTNQCSLWQSRAFEIIGVCQTETGNYLEGIESLQVAAEMARTAGKKGNVELASALHDLAISQDDASMLREALAIATGENDFEMIGLASANLAGMVIKEGALDEACALLESAEEIAHGRSLYSLLSYIFSVQGEYFCNIGEEEVAAEKFSAGLSLAKEREDPFLIVLNLRYFAEFKQRFGHHNETLALLEEAIEISADMSHKPILADFYRMQSTSYEALGQLAKSLAAFKLADKLKDQLHEEQREKQRSVLKEAHLAETLRLEARLERDKNKELADLVAKRTEALACSLERENTLTHDLEVALIEEAEVSALKSKIINNISHEFRTPLTIIHNASDILHIYRDRLSEEKQNIHYRRIKEAITNLTDSLSDVIAVGDSTSATIRQKTTSTPFSLLVEQIVNHDECHSIIDNQLMVQHDATCDAVLDVDVAFVARVLGQLVNNSLKYCDVKDTIVISFGVDGVDLTFSVADGGIGVPIGEADRVFELFYRASNVDTRRGIGLGLYNLYKSVRKMNGSARLTSDGINQGCLVEVCIPDVLNDEAAIKQSGVPVAT